MFSKERVLAAVAVAAACAAAQAEVHVFTAHISGDNEVPPTGSPAVGFLSGVYDDVANTFEFSWLITPNLIGTPSSPGAHIHRAPIGENGGIVFPFSEPDGSWELFGSATWTDLTAQNVEDLFAGNLYANFHTTAFPSGEVRGQILALPAPGALGLAGAALVLCVRRRR